MFLPVSLPDLEERFLPPPNWQSGNFINPETDHYIHYNFLPASKDNYKANIVVLPGLSEFGEKYIETARFFHEQGYGFYVIDWAYQGRSSRFKNNHHKRHSDGYESDISDLNYLIKNIIPSDKPLHLLAHSMGGNIGLRYILKHPNIIKSASFSAPMLGIKDLKYTGWLIKPILGTLCFLSNKYIPGGKDWHEAARKSNGEDIFSHDPIRDQIHNKWCLTNPELQIGNPTFKWIYESLKSISLLKKKETLKKITTPILLSIAEKEVLVDNDSIKKAAEYLPNAQCSLLKKARHEILMETDDIRNEFLDKTLNLFNQ